MVKFNLLPTEASKSNAQSRQRNLSVVLIIAVLAGLSVLHLGQISRAAIAQNNLEGEQELLAQQQQQVAAMQPFADLQTRRTSIETVVQLATANELSFADLLTDVAASAPDTMWLEVVGVTTTNEIDSPLGTDARTMGRVTLTGVDTGRLSTGVTSILAAYEDVDGFANTFLVNSTQVAPETFSDQTGDERRFAVEFDLAVERRAERYADGLNAELQPIVDAILETGIYESEAITIQPDSADLNGPDEGNEPDEDSPDENDDAQEDDS